MRAHHHVGSRLAGRVSSLQKAIQDIAVQAWHRNAFLLKLLTEIGDHHNLASDRPPTE
jgi:hypothetical protein